VEILLEFDFKMCVDDSVVSSTPTATTNLSEVAIDDDQSMLEEFLSSTQISGKQEQHLSTFEDIFDSVTTLLCASRLRLCRQCSLLCIIGPQCTLQHKNAKRIHNF